MFSVEAANVQTKENECVGFPHVSGVLRYIHTTIIFLMLIIFTFAVYAGAGDCSNLYGSPAKVYDGLTAASELVPQAMPFAKTKHSRKMMPKPGMKFLNTTSAVRVDEVVLYL